MSWQKGTLGIMVQRGRCSSTLRPPSARAWYRSYPQTGPRGHFSVGANMQIWFDIKSET